MNISRMILCIALAICSALPVSVNATPKDEPLNDELKPSLIIGKWDTSKKDSQAGATVEAKISYDFTSGNAVSLNSEMKLIFPINENGYRNVLTFSFNFTASGNYTLEADKLTVDFDDDSITVEYMPATAETDDAISQQMLPLIAQAIPEMEKELRKNIANPETYTVTSLSKNKMELTTDDNHTIKFKRK